MSVVNSVASTRGGMNAPDRRHAVCAKHGCQKTGTLMKAQVAEAEEEGRLGG